jgi:hypothetical protein
VDVVNRSHHPARRAFLGVGFGVVLLVGVASPAAQSGFVNSLLRQERFSAADLRALDAGEVVVKTLDTPVRQELAHFGAVYIDAQPTGSSIGSLTSSGSSVVPASPRSGGSASLRDLRI